MSPFFQRLKAVCDMIKIEHSIFALPYAWAGAFLAYNGLPPWRPLIFLTIAMVAIRSVAMTFNRIADARIDAKNPRTFLRALVTGEISRKDAWLFLLAMAIIFFISCALLNDVCLALSLPVLLFCTLYSYTKRFTPYCHFWLGATLGLAPLAGWLAVNPTVPGLSVILLFLAVTFWVGAFDIYYSMQDLEPDIFNRIHSIPADFGPDTGMRLAAFSHCLTIIFLLLAGYAANLGWPWYALCCGIAILLFLESRLVKPDDLRHVNTAFFTLNGIISPLVLAGVILGIYF